LMNFQRDSNLREKSGKFSKIPSRLIFIELNLVGITCMQQF
jgi:hypothetical protein